VAEVAASWQILYVVSRDLLFRVGAEALWLVKHGLAEEEVGFSRKIGP